MSTPLAIRIVTWFWLLAALLAGNYGLVGRLPLPALPALIVLLAGLVLLAYARVAPIRAWLDGLDLRAIVLLHITRLVGFYFLFLHQRGYLPYAYAVPAGWGDILIAVFALIVVFVPTTEAVRLRALGFWNIVGLADLLLVIATATRLTLHGEPLMRNLAALPLSLLPTFLTPLLLATHVIIMLRLRRADGGQVA